MEVRTAEGVNSGTSCPERAINAYVQFRSWWTIPMKFPESSVNGVEGFLVKP